MNIAPEHRRFLFIEQTLAGAAVNIGIAGLLGWLLFRHAERVPITGSGGVMADTVATAFMVSFATCLIVTPIVRAQVERGRLSLLEPSKLSSLMPQSVFWRAIVLGLICTAVVIPTLTAACAVFGIRSVSLRHFLVFKLVFAGVEGALATPVITFAALSHLAAPDRRIAFQRFEGKAPLD
jgi:hypothetical protein